MTSPVAAQDPTRTGGCQCGAVRYRLDGVPRTIAVCHCRMCQRATGTPMLAVLIMHRADVTWSRGAPTWFASSDVAERGFCPTCGTHLAFRFQADHPREDDLDITLPSIDDPSGYQPRFETGIESRPEWVTQLGQFPHRQTPGASERPIVRSRQRFDGR